MENKPNINSVDVLSVDEQRLKFRVIASHYGAPAGGNPNRINERGSFTIRLPPLTSIANSHEYNSAVVKIDAFTCHTGQLVNDTSWCYNDPGAGPGVIKLSSVIINCNFPTSQVIAIDTDANTQLGIGNVISQGFNQLLPVQIVNVGNGASFTPNATGYACVGIGSGISSTDPVLIGNPFGKDLTINIKAPSFKAGSNVWLGSAANAAFDVGVYNISMTIQLIKNS